MEPHDPLASLCIDSSGNAPSRRGAVESFAGAPRFQASGVRGDGLDAICDPVTRSSILLNIKYSRDSRREFSR